MKYIVVALAVLAGRTVLAGPASAQADRQAAGWYGAVVGQVSNNTPDGPIPAGAAVMLHAWDAAGAEQLMLDGEVGADGFFRFEDVPMQEGWAFGSMLTYLGAVYFSDVVAVEPGIQEVFLRVGVFETTADDDSVLIDRAHVIFGFNTDGLTVAELYILSNTGDRTVAGSESLADGSAAALRFPLPPEAWAVGFEGGDQSRFTIVQGGFVDRQPLTPGESTGRVFVSFALEYDRGATYSLTASYPIGAVSVLLPADSGVTLEGEGMTMIEPRTTQTGESFEVYAFEALDRGQTLTLSLRGEPDPSVVSQGAEGGMGSQESAPSGPLGGSLGLVVGAAALGLALVGLGVWWWRRPDEAHPPATDDWADALDVILEKVEALDRLEDRGRVSPEDYGLRRQELRAQALEVLSSDQAEKASDP